MEATPEASTRGPAVAQGDRTEAPSFSRGHNELTTELRGECPRWIVEVIDAVAMARGGQSANVHRATIVNEVLAEWAEKKRHEASLIQRIAGLNPTGTETGGLQGLRVVGDVK